MLWRSMMLGCSLATTAACAVYGPGDGDGGDDAEPSGGEGYLAVVSGWDVDGPLSGTMQLEDDAGALSGLLRVRSGAGTVTEHDVTGSIAESSGELRWEDVVMPLDVEGDAFEGSYELPDGTGAIVAGSRTDLGTGRALCGTYDGDDAGVWNFVVTDKNVLRGAFSGWVSGTLTGHVDGGRVTIEWTVPDDLAGTADGSIEGTNAIGSWVGSDVAGTWASDTAVCP